MRILLIVLCLAFLLLSGCVSQGKYDDLQAENALRQAQVQTLIKDNIELQHQMDALLYEHEVLQEDYAKVINPREFKDVEELNWWLSIDDTDKMEFIDDIQDCDDFARILMLNSFEDGYILGILVDGEHIKNVTFIGAEVYLIEPQTDEIEFGGFLWE